MNGLAKILWAFFFAAMFFGIWTIPVLMAVAVVSLLIRYMWPDGFNKHP